MAKAKSKDKQVAISAETRAILEQIRDGRTVKGTIARLAHAEFSRLTVKPRK